jgi:RimK family alpha-L-glutamate ligase
MLTPGEAVRALTPRDLALGRLDVLPGLDGVEDGLWALGALGARGVRVLNTPSALLACHDKLLTARLLERAGLPHPRTQHVTVVDPGVVAVPDCGVVVKPRFGSMGQGVVRVADGRGLRRALLAIENTAWFRKHGAIVQELVPPVGYDLRVLVVGTRVIGGVKRVSREGEWRTNVALGARRRPTEVPENAQVLALRAALAFGISLVGVDLLPVAGGGWVVLELNGAVEFTRTYNRSSDVFALARAELACHASASASAYAGARSVVPRVEFVSDEVAGSMTVDRLD